MFKFKITPHNPNTMPQNNCSLADRNEYFLYVYFYKRLHAVIIANGVIRILSIVNLWHNEYGSFLISFVLNNHWLAYRIL